MPRSRLVALLATLVLTGSACTSAASPSPTPVATTAASSAAASASAAPATVGPPEATTLKVGVDGLPDFTNEGAYKWAADLKAQYGVDATIVDLGSTAGPFRAMVAGDVDMVIGQVEPGVSLRMQDGDRHQDDRGRRHVIRLHTPFYAEHRNSRRSDRQEGRHPGAGFRQRDPYQSGAEARRS